MSSANLSALMARFEAPLTEMIRPANFSEYIGQEHLLDPKNGEITNYLRLGYLPSMVLSGPPGVGKTSLARLLADEANYVFVEFSATSSTVADLKELSGALEAENTKRAQKMTPLSRLRVLVFIDEIHRFSTVQQDFLLPFIESGAFVFVGATTVDPQKSVRRAILSRCHLFKLCNLGNHHIERVVRRAILYENIRRKTSRNLRFLEYSDAAVLTVVKFAAGDMRSAVNLVELMDARLSSADFAIAKERVEIEVDENMVNSLIQSQNRARFGLQSEANTPLLYRLLKYLRFPRSLATRKDDGNRADLPGNKVGFPEKSDSEPDSDLESWVDENEYLEYKGEPKRQAWADHIPYSDDEVAEPGPLYSEEENDTSSFKGHDLSRFSASKFRILAATHACVQLLEQGESPLSLLKYLVLFTCTHAKPEKNELIKVLSVFKAIKKTGVGGEQMLFNCIERLAGTGCYEQRSLRDILEIGKKYFSKKESVDTGEGVTLGECDVVFDDEMVEMLLQDLPDDREAERLDIAVTLLKDLGSDYILGEGSDMESVLETPDERFN